MSRAIEKMPIETTVGCHSSPAGMSKTRQTDNSVSADTGTRPLTGSWGRGWKGPQPFWKHWGSSS